MELKHSLSENWHWIPITNKLSDTSKAVQGGYGKILNWYGYALTHISTHTWSSVFGAFDVEAIYISHGNIDRKRFKLHKTFLSWNFGTQLLTCCRDNTEKGLSWSGIVFLNVATTESSWHDFLHYRLKKGFLAVLILALSCYHDNTQKRPSMVDVMRKLKKYCCKLPGTSSSFSDIVSHYDGKVA
ncbi:hypothetical protein VNO77_20776 [Canavalia gladiata]|uniref:Uncharacterized protein n=1 Tax=Canavalia gladiata TaxID=3824 RepID=A0AAN9QLQ4_CANGL